MKALLLAILSCGLASAQTPPSLPPPPAQSAWEISFKSERERERRPVEQASGALVDLFQMQATIESRDYTVNGLLGRTVTRYSDGRSVTTYIMGRVGVEENPQDPQDLIIIDLGSIWFSQSDFRRHYPGLEWVRPAFYKGVVEFRGDPHYYFAEGEAPPVAPSVANAMETVMADPTENPERGRKAWFGMDGRPVAYQDRDITATFTHKTSVSRIEVPERFQAAAQRFIDSLSGGVRD